MAGVPTICAASSQLADGKIRNSDNPCGYWCSAVDFRDWRAGARFQVERALTRGDLPADVKATLRTYLQEVDTSQINSLTVGTVTRRLARIHQAAQCAAMWDPRQTPPTIPTTAQLDREAEVGPSIAKTIETVALVAALAYVAAQVLKDAR